MSREKKLTAHTIIFIIQALKKKYTVTYIEGIDPILHRPYF